MIFSPCVSLKYSYAWIFHTIVTSAYMLVATKNYRNIAVVTHSSTYLTSAAPSIIYTFPFGNKGFPFSLMQFIFCTVGAKIRH